MQRGKILQIKNIGIGAPKARFLPSDFDKCTAKKQLKTFLEITTGLANESNVNILLEPVHSGLCNYINYSKEAVDVVKELEIDDLFILLDFYHMEVMGEKIESVDLVAPFLKHTYISTNEENNTRLFPQWSEIEKYTEIINKLNNIGYYGTMSVESSNFDYEKAIICIDMLRKASRR